MFLVYLLLALLAGAMLPLQAGVNSQLARAVGHPVVAALVSFVVGTLGLLAYCLVMRYPMPSGAAVSQAPWWAWVGGLMGVIFITVVVTLAPKLGAVRLLSFAIAGQLLFSVIIDHFGLVGFEIRPINFWRIAGVALLLAGVALVRLF